MDKIKTENLLLIALLVIVIAGLGFAFFGFFKNSSSTAIKAKDTQLLPEVTKPTSGSSKGLFETKSSSSKVSIDLTPSSFENGKLYVGSSFTTHSGDLADYNLKELVTLEVNGLSFKPESAPSLSQHHGEGVFVFNVGEKPEKFTIKIKGIPEIGERVFSWP